MPRAGVKVRGACRAGHVTEATAEPGRVTWQGKCVADKPTGGQCGLPVHAKRIPIERPQPDGPVTDLDNRYRVVKVKAFNDQPPEHGAGAGGVDGEPAGGAGVPASGQRAPGSGAPAGLTVDTASAGAGAAVPSAAPDDGGPPDPIDGPGRAGRLTDKLRRGRAARPARTGREYRHPLIG